MGHSSDSSARSQLTPPRAIDFSGLALGAFRDSPAQLTWQQLNVALERKNGDALPSARALFGAVTPLLAEWHREGTLHAWFFMRKPPDVRLRIALHSDGAEERLELEQRLLPLRDLGSIAEAFWSAYEAEEERFGGPAGMRLAHAYFNADSTLWWRMEELQAAGARVIASDTLMLSVLHDLFLRVCAAPAATHAWRALAALLGTPSHSPQRKAGPVPSALDALIRRAEGDERETLQTYADANATYARHLIELERCGAVAAWLPEIVATVAFFNLNRHGYSGERSAPLVAQTVVAVEASPLQSAR